MGNRLDKIVNVTIDVASPPAVSQGYDRMLIVGLPPAIDPATPLPDVGVYYSLLEVSEAGWATTGTNADPVGVAARVAFSQNPKPPAIYIAAMQESESDVLEAPTATLDRALVTDGWYAICTAGVEATSFQAIAEWTEAQEKIFGYTFLAETDPVPATFYRSHGWCGLTAPGQQVANVPAANVHLAVAATAKALSFPAGSETWALKQLAALEPSALGGTLENALEAGGSNYFARFGGRNITMVGKMRSGEWIDVIRGRDWLRNDIQLRVFSLLLRLAKLLYTDQDIGLVQAQIIASLDAGTTRGVVAPDEFGEDGERIPGFTTTVPLAATIPSEQRASRILEGCRFSARLAGAIHAVEINGAMSY